ncbi:MAG: hypothetical protein J2P25_23940, partial [Nocardiopsaceae bacterium]|nr:hypothetical protein [Nocardiopsaceae bacterium]
GAAGTSAGLASQPEVDNAITALVDAVDGRLPESWSASVQRAARSRAGEVPAALADALRLAVPRHPAVPLRWRLVAAWQWLLLLLAVAAVAWAVVLGVTHGSHELRHLLGPNALREPTSPGDVVLTVWLPVLAVVLLLLGWLTSAACRNMGVAAVDRDRERAGIVMREHVAAVARGLVLAPVGREIAVYERFRRELSVARGGTPVAYGEFPVAYGNADRGDQSV